MTQAFAIGFTILERSKGLIFSDYYNKILPALDYQCTSVFTDTDSLCLRVTAPLSWEEIMDKLESVMDFSNYPKAHLRHSTAHTNAPGYWKDEMKGSVDILEWVGLASKCYSMRLLPHHTATAALTDGNETFDSKSKGVSKAYRKKIPFSEYKKCIVGVASHSVEAYTIQSKNHVIRTMKIHRQCFSSFDDKRYVMPCGLHTVGYGSHLILVSQLSKQCPFCK
jgi:hypothetical protein